MNTYKVTFTYEQEIEAETAERAEETLESLIREGYTWPAFIDIDTIITESGKYKYQETWYDTEDDVIAALVTNGELPTFSAWVSIEFDSYDVLMMNKPLSFYQAAYQEYLSNEFENYWEKELYVG